MRDLRRYAAIVVTLAACLSPGPLVAADPATSTATSTVTSTVTSTATGAVPVPDGYRMTDYRSPTPASLPGAVTVDTAEARRLIDSGAVVAVNVLKLDRSTLPGGPWILAKRFEQIPGSVWLPNVGLGALTPELDGYFRANLESLTKGDRGRGLLFYCLADCWMSWNAAKRALELGYGRIHWYRDGVDGWAEAGLPTENAVPVPVAAAQ